jgi:hypothetical protein
MSIFAISIVISIVSIYHICMRVYSHSTKKKSFFACILLFFLCFQKRKKTKILKSFTGFGSPPFSCIPSKTIIFLYLFFSLSFLSYFFLHYNSGYIFTFLLFVFFSIPKCQIHFHRHRRKLYHHFLRSLYI